MLPQIERDGEWEGEMPIRHFQTGAPIPMHVNAFVIKEEGTGRPLALATISRDISERKEAEQKLHEAQAELAHVTRLNTLGEIGSSIAHEINQPLGRSSITVMSVSSSWVGAGSKKEYATSLSILPTTRFEPAPSLRAFAP